MRRVGYWYDYVRTPGGEKRLQRSKVLGFCDEITEPEARGALQVIIGCETSQSHALALVASPEHGAAIALADARTSAGAALNLANASSI